MKSHADIGAFRASAFVEVAQGRIVDAVRTANGSGTLVISQIRTCLQALAGGLGAVATSHALGTSGAVQLAARIFDLCNARRMDGHFQ